MFHSKPIVLRTKNNPLNDHLLPLTKHPEPDQESEVQLLLKEVEKREGTARSIWHDMPLAAARQTHDGGR